MPGKRDASPTWARRYDAFIINELGFHQSVVDLRVFYIVSDLGKMILLVHVDDSRLIFTTPKIHAWFLARWTAKFKEPPASSTLNREFVGIRRLRTGPHTYELTAGGVVKALSDLIKPYPIPNGGAHLDTPMAENAPRELREGPTDSNQLVPDLVPIER